VPDIDDPDHLPCLIDEVEEAVRPHDELAAPMLGKLWNAMTAPRIPGQALVSALQAAQEARRGEGVDGVKLRDDLFDPRLGFVEVADEHV